MKKYSQIIYLIIFILVEILLAYFTYNSSFLKWALAFLFGTILTWVIIIGVFILPFKKGDDHHH